MNFDEMIYLRDKINELLLSELDDIESQKATVHQASHALEALARTGEPIRSIAESEIVRLVKLFHNNRDLFRGPISAHMKQICKTEDALAIAIRECSDAQKTGSYDDLSRAVSNAEKVMRDKYINRSV